MNTLYITSDEYCEAAVHLLLQPSDYVLGFDVEFIGPSVCVIQLSSSGVAVVFHVALFNGE